MVRQSLIYLVMSFFVVIFATYAHTLILYLDMLYTYLNIQMAPVFSNSYTGVLIRKTLSLVIIPVAIAALPALVYRLIKGQHMPYFIEVTWLLWLIIVLSKVLVQ